MDRSFRPRIVRPSSTLKSTLSNSITSAPHKDLSSAWDSMDKAKSALRRAEYRLTDIEKPSSADILWNLPDYLFSMIEQDNQASFNLTQTPDSVHASDAKSPKSMNRKINKPGLSYVETHQPNDSNGNQSALSGGNIRLSSVDSSLPTAITDFSETGISNRSRSNASYAWSKLNSVNMPSAVESDVTSSTVIRETDINFLNDFAIGKQAVSVPAARMHRVNVVVPTAHNVSTASHTITKSTHSFPANTQQLRNLASQLVPLQQKLKVTFVDTKHEGKSDSGNNVGDSSQPSSDVDSLERIREMIKRQPPVEFTDDVSSASSELVAHDTAVARKVASGPRLAVPSYKGFNEIDSKAEHSKFKPAVSKLDQMKVKYVPSYQLDGQLPANTSYRPHRTIAPSSDNKDVITTHAWRSGAKLVLEDLGVSITGASVPMKDSRTQPSSSASKAHETVLNIFKSSEGNPRLEDMVKIDSDDGSAKKRLVESYYPNKPDWKSKSKKKPEHSHKAITDKNLHSESKDAAEVRRYMLKRREKHLLQERQEQLMKEEVNAKKKQKLVELMQKQQELVAASVAVSREKTSKQKGSSVLCEADKENMLLTPALEETSIASKTESENFDNRHHYHSQYRSHPPVENKTVTLASKTLNGKVAVSSDFEGSLSAEQIVNRFAENAGLGLDDVISNYSQYAQAIQQSFVHRGDSAKLNESNHRGFSTNRRSTMSRLKALQSASVQLQSRLQQETVRIQNDFAGQGSLGSNSDRFNEPAAGNYSINSVTHAPFEFDLPGYMGPQADGKVSHHVSPADEIVTRNMRPINSTAISQNMVAPNSANESDKNALRQPPEQDVLCASHSVMHSSWLANAVSTDPYVLKPMKPIIAWQQAEPDPFNIFSILSRSHKLVEIHPTKGRLTTVNIAGDVYPSQDISSDRLRSAADVEKKTSSFNHHKVYTNLMLKGASDEDLNSGSMWSVSLSGRDQEVGMHGEKLARSEINTHSEVPQHGVSSGVVMDAMPCSARSLQTSADSFASSYKDDLTDNSESILVDRFTDHQKSLSRPSGHPLVKSMEDTTGKKLVPSSTAIDKSNMDDTDTDASEFPDVSSLTSDHQAVSFSLHQYKRTAAELKHHFTRDYGGIQGISPAALDLRMALELSRLDMVGNSLLQVTNLERTRAVSLSQQETVALAQILKARQQKAAQDIAEARLKAEVENLDLTKKYAASHQVDAANSLVRAATNATTTLHESARTLASTQGDMARVTAEAVRQIAETSVLVLKRRDEDLEASHRMIAESAATAAASAVAGIVEQYQAQRPYTVGRQDEVKYHGENVRSRSVTPHSEAPSLKASERSIGGSASARSDRSVTENDKSYSVSMSHRSKSRSVDLSGRSDKSQSKRSNSHAVEIRSTITEDVSTAVDVSNRNVRSESSKKSRKRDAAVSENTSPDSSEIHSATDLSLKSISAVSDCSTVHTATDQTAGKKPRYSIGSIESSIHTKSVASAHDEVSTDDDSESYVHTESTRKSQSLQQSVKSNQQVTEDEKALDYTFDYDSTMTEDDLEKSLREIVPSEGQRKKMRSKKLLDTSIVEGGETDAAEDLAIAPDDSFTRFNMAMVQQYFREEAIHQQHKHTMLLLRERALKEKTALELAFLDQMKQRLRDKGADDKHPDIIRKEKNIRKNHQLRQEELRRLQKASKFALEAQQVMLQETHDIAEIHRSSQQVKDKLKRAGVDPLLLSSPDLVTDTEQSPRTILDEVDRVHTTGDESVRDKLKLELKLDKKYLTEREKQLRDRRRKVIEKLDVNERLKLKEEEIKHLEKKTKQLERLKEDRKRTVENSMVEANSLTTDLPEMDVLDTSRTKPPSSIAEDLPSEHFRRNRSLASVGEDLASIMSSARRTKSVSTAVDIGTESVKDSSVAEESSISEDILDVRSISDSTETSVGYSRENFDSVTEVTEHTATRRASYAVLSVNVSKQLDHPIVKSDLSQNSKLQRQLSAGVESDVSINRSDVTSDHSDIENRIQSLTEKLKKCKSEANNLRREQRRQRKMRLKAEEQSLRQQIESYDSYIRLVKSELQTSPATQQLTSLVPSFIASALDVHKTSRPNNFAGKSRTASDDVQKASTASDDVEINTAPSDDIQNTSPMTADTRKSSMPLKPQSSDSSGSDMTVVHDSSRRELHRSLSSNGEPVKSSSEQLEKRKTSDVSLSESVIEDVNTAFDDASSLKLDLCASVTSDRLLSAITPRAVDSARTLADISEEYPISALTTARDESSVMGGVKQRGSDSPKLAKSSRPVSVMSSGASYSEDFSSVGQTGSMEVPLGKHNNSAQPSASQRNDRLSEEIVPTEEDVSDAALSDNEVVSDSISIITQAKMSQTRPIHLSNTDLKIVPVELPESPSSSPHNDKGVVKDNQKVARLADGLVSEAIEQMLNIKKQKENASSSDDINSKPAAVPTLVHSVGTSTIPIPSLGPTDNQLDVMSHIDDMYSDLTSLKLDDDWLIEREQIVEPQTSVSARQPVVAAPERVVYVPHTITEVSRLIDSAVDVLWPNHRDAKLREAARTSFVVDHDDSNNTNESRSRSVYKRLVYDLSVQAISELCDDSLSYVDATTQPWLQPRLRVRAPIPATAAAAKPLVSKAVLRRLGLQTNRLSSASLRHSGRKVVRRQRADRVDELLSAELREEESEWTDYTNDELYVKMQLADVLFDMLLSETVITLNSIHTNRKP